MGCPCSKSLQKQTAGTLNPLQQLQQREASEQRLPSRRRRQREQKHQRQLAKLHKRHAKKRQQRKFNQLLGPQNGNLAAADSSEQPAAGCLPAQLRLLGGSNGSSSTETTSTVYARLLEQQQEEQQQLIEQQTRQHLERQLHTFLLNQLVLMTQFFANYDIELAAIEEQLQARCRDSCQLLADQTLLFASAIDMAVDKHLKFKPMHGALKHGSTQPLQHPLTYVVFENVDVARPNDANYDAIATLCKVLMETNYYQSTPCSANFQQLLEQTRWKGYVRLKLREQTQPSTSKPTCKANSTSSCNYMAEEGEGKGEGDAEAEIYTDGSTSGYSTAASVNSSAKGLRLSREKKAETTFVSPAGASFDADDDNYDYLYLGRLNSHRPLAELKLPTPLRCNVLPEICVSKLANFVQPDMEQSDDEEEDEDADEEDQQIDGEEEYPDEANGECKEPANSRRAYEPVQVLRQCRVEQQHHRQLLQQSYLNSGQFMNYFGELLRQQLAPQLGLSQSQLAGASYRGCSIFTASGMELVPAIHVPHGWPDCAFEFNLRARPVIRDEQTGQQLQWPTADMRKRIQTFGFHVVPLGYAPKRGWNPFRELEWRIVFPQAEQFLERQLTRTQLKVFLLVKVLMKTFVATHEQAQEMAHALEHLRMHLFWECERHYNAWPEQFLGEVLVRFVRSFADCLVKKELPDYFIPRRNLFELLTEQTLMTLHSIVAGIAEQPLMHLLLALRNLEHADDFFPKLDYRRLFENVVSQDFFQLRSWAKFARPQLLERQPAGSSTAAAASEAETKTTIDQQQQTAKGLLGMPQHQERTRGKLRRKTQLLRAQQQRQQQQLSEQRRSSIDSLDMQLLTSSSTAGSAAQPLNDGVEILRRTNLLELLMDHMLLLLSKANEFRNVSQGQLYLEQTQRLCCLYKQLGCGQNAQHYTAALREAAAQLEQTQQQSPLPAPPAHYFEHLPPALPQRLSVSSQRPPQESFVAVSMQRKSVKFVEPPSRANETSLVESITVETAVEVIGQAGTGVSAAASSAESSALSALLHKLSKEQLLKLSKDELLQTLAPPLETKRVELCDLVKRQRGKLRDILN